MWSTAGLLWKFSYYIMFIRGRYQALPFFCTASHRKWGGALGTRLTCRSLPPCFQSSLNLHLHVCGSFWWKSNTILPFSKCTFWLHIFKWASLLQAVRLQITSKTATIQYETVTSLAGNNNTLAHYEQSRSYDQISHALSNIHGLYWCICNLLDVISVYSLNPGKLPGRFSYKRVRGYIDVWILDTELSAIWVQCCWFRLLLQIVQVQVCICLWKYLLVIACWTLLLYG